MRRRILVAIVAVTAVAVVSFGVPLALIIARLYHDEAVTDLERQAGRAAVEVPASSLTGNDPVELPPTEPAIDLAVYGADGRRLLGDGPAEGDVLVRRALGGVVADATIDGALVVAVPVTSEERVFAVVRAARPGSEIGNRVYRAWLAMAGLGALIVALAAVVARGQAGRLSRPVLDLVDTAERLGEGDFSARATASGVAELDAAGRALSETAERLGALVTRERAFSANASHQLRTPLTGLRLLLENAAVGTVTDSMEEAIREVDRLEQTIEDLLRLARDSERSRGVFDVNELLGAAEHDWQGRFGAQDRPLIVSARLPFPVVSASRIAVRQIVDILLANALEHGAGEVTLTARTTIGGGVSIEVGDEGPGVQGDPSALFVRRGQRTDGRGIGLPMAATLADGEGARLSVLRPGNDPVFSLLLPEADRRVRGPRSPGADQFGGSDAPDE